MKWFVTEPDKSLSGHFLCAPVELMSGGQRHAGLFGHPALVVALTWQRYAANFLVLLLLYYILLIVLFLLLLITVSIFWIALCFGMFIRQWFKRWYWLEKWTSPRLTQVWKPFWSQEHLREVCGNSRRHLGVIWFCRDESGKFLMTQ